MFDGTPLQPRTVRIATATDERALFDLLMGLAEDNPDPASLPIAKPKIEKFVRAACTGNGGIAGVIDGPSGLVASVGVFLNQPWYTEAWTLSTHWLYVDPAYRASGRLSAALFKFALQHRRDLSRLSGMALGLDISFVSKKRVAARTRLWRRYAPQHGAMFYVFPDEPQ